MGRHSRVGLTLQHAARLKGMTKLSRTCQLQGDRAGLCAMAVAGTARKGPQVSAAHPADPQTILVVIWLAQFIHTRARLQEGSPAAKIGDMRSGLASGGAGAG